MRLLACLLAALPLLGCGSDTTDSNERDIAAVRAVTMGARPLTWTELSIHPELRLRACAVSTLVDTNGTTVGYCEGSGRRCRTNDWRPVEDGCLGPRGQGVSRYRPATAPPR